MEEEGGPLKNTIARGAAAALLALGLCLPAAGYLDPSYSGDLDPATGLPAAMAQQVNQGSVVPLGEGCGFDRDSQRYVIQVGSYSFTASVPPGIILDKDGTVSIQLPEQLTGTLYKNGDLVDQPDLSQISGAGSYLLYVRSASGFDEARFAFTIQSSPTRTLIEYALPEGFSFTSVTIDGQDLSAGYSNYIELLSEGEYRLQYACEEIARSYSLTFTVDRTAPVLALPQVVEGEAQEPVTIEDLEAGTWLDVDCDGEVRQVASAQTVFSEPGRYIITTHDQAGNSNTYRFIIHFYLNISAVTAIALAAGGLIGLIFYSRWVRKHARVG